MIGELLTLAYDVAGLVPGASEAEKVLAVGIDAYNAFEALQAFLASPEGQKTEADLDALFHTGKIPGKALTITPIIFVNPDLKSGRRGSTG